MAKGPGKRTWPKGMPRRNDANFDRQLIARAAPGSLPDRLPIVHATASTPAKEIIRARKLVTKRCPVFDTELVYFFVLRPAYRCTFGEEATHQLSRFPVTFILKPEAVHDPRHVYPFDTGGAAMGAFAKQADKFVKLEDYALAPSHAAATSHIGWAFSSIDAYFEGRLKDGIQDEIKPFEDVVSGYVDVARMGVEGSNEHDRRASTIEVAASHDVDLVGNVLLTIAPKQLLEGNDPLNDELGTVGGDIRVYDWQPNRAPDEFQKDILRISREWYRKKGHMP